MYSSAGKWCDFGGGMCAGESIEDAAAREFVEESLGCVFFDPYVGVKNQRNYLRNMLQNRDYLMKVDIDIKRKRKRQVKTYFIKEIPWQPGVTDRFKMLRKSLMQVYKNPTKCPFSLRNHPAIAASYKRVFVDRHYLEKQHIAWWSLTRLTEVLNKGGRYKNQVFRKSFLPILRVLVQKLKR